MFICLYVKIVILFEITNLKCRPSLIDIRFRFVVKVRGNTGLSCVQRLSKTDKTVSSKVEKAEQVHDY